MKRAVVTGAAQGIGLAVAQALKAAGHSVIGVDRQPLGEHIAGLYSQLGLAEDEDRLRAMLAEPRWDIYEQLDISDPEAIMGFAQKIGPVDYLVNCAGVCVTQQLDEISVECWDRTQDINTRGPFLLGRELAKSMGPGCAIVNMVSVSGFLPKLEQVDYGASKAALVSLTRSMALIYGPKGIRVNAVAPGVIETPLTHQIAEQRGKLRGVDPMETLQPVIQNTPLRRIGTAQEVAKAVLFLLSDDASFITGQTLNVCGGFLMR